MVGGGDGGGGGGGGVIVGWWRWTVAVDGGGSVVELVDSPYRHHTQILLTLHLLLALALALLPLLPLAVTSRTPSRSFIIVGRDQADGL